MILSPSLQTLLPNRVEAGRRLVEPLLKYANGSDVIILALPRGVERNADLRLPTNTRALLVFVHGSGSGRLSPRNQYMADVLTHRGLGSLLFDLLTETEQRLDNLRRIRILTHARFINLFKRVCR